MNRMDRLLAIVLELQGRGQLRAEDLAATFEVSKRTIYRDVQALCEAGVPIVSMTGQGYSVMEGYFLPPLNFTADEALMLVLGSDFMAQNFDAQYRAAAESASSKIEAVLPDRLRGDVDYLRANINFFAAPPLPTQDGGEGGFNKLHQLRRAIIDRRTVRLNYSKRFAHNGDETQTTRDVDPYSLARLTSDWYLLAYCHLRQDFRIFRLGRIDALQVLGQTFLREMDFQPDWMNPSQSEQIEVRALFDPAVARWVRESNSYFSTKAEETADGLLVTLWPRNEEEVLQWLLSWGGNVRVLEPASLQWKLVAEAQRVIQTYHR